MELCTAEAILNRDIPSSVKVDGRNQFISVEGSRRVSDVMIGDVPLDPEKEYTLTGASFLLSGGDGNEVVMKYIEENLNGVIPETYKEISGERIRQDSKVKAAA